ncbi:MAG TPA: amidase [Anaeromyxobacter sp.]|nr:amidase [Anaeromyxobacter sp.]
MRLPEYDRLDALALADLVARREVSAAELLEAALERADARNPRLNAIVARYDDEARARARGPLPPGPLSGVPFLLKDLLAAWKGHPLTSSSRLLEGYVADEDAEVVRRFHAAGLVTFGQTNSPEFGILGTTEPVLRGPTRNPWNPGRSAGGSSGGAAAAVAARIVPAAHGNDGGGSLRIPASACGIFGLKPTRGRVPLAPALGESWSGLATDGVVTRSVRDGAALLDVIAGPAPGDPYGVAPAARPFREEVGAEPGRLRIAFSHGPFFGRAVEGECRAAVDGTARLLAGLGHELVEATPPFSRDALLHAYLVVVGAGIAADVDEGARRTGRSPSAALLEPETLALAAAGRSLSAEDLELARRDIHRASRAIAAFFREHDVLLTPTTGQPALPIGAVATGAVERLQLRTVAALGSRALLERMLHEIGARSFDSTGNTMLFNQTGQPAMSVPLHWTADGIPLGSQLVGRFGDEATLFRLAAQLEAARPWADRAPPLS